MSEIVLRREIACSMSPSALFAVLADTDKLYRALGQVEIAREPLLGEGAARFLLRARVGARSIPFAELPAQWNQPTLLVTKRVLHQGVLTSLTTRFTLTPQLQGTQLLVELQVEPRQTQLAWLVKFFAIGTLWHLCRTIRRFDEGVTRGQKPQLRPAKLLAEPLKEAQQKTKAELSAEDQPSVDALLNSLRGCDDLEVDALRLPTLSETLQQTEEKTLKLLLVACAHGLLQPSYGVLCPSCRSSVTQQDSLRELSDEAFCTFCEIRIPVELAQNVEVTFRPAQALRALPRPLYSSFNPAKTPHVIAQVVLPGATKLAVPVPNEPGEFRLWARGGAAATLKVSTLGPPHASVVIGDSIVPPSVEVGMGGTLELDHQTGQARHFKIERMEHIQPGLTAHKFTLHPLFRRLFPEDFPSANIQFPVPLVTFVRSRFAMVGELCAALGDGGAFRLLSDCQQAIRNALEEQGGAVLCVEPEGLSFAFPDQAQALSAAILAKRAAQHFRADNPFAHLLSLKMSLCTGPSTLVRLDHRLDYFGQTVATCDRMLVEAHPGDVVLPAECLKEVSAHEKAKAGPIFSLVGKGLPAAISVFRLNLEP